MPDRIIAERAPAHSEKRVIVQSTTRTPSRRRKPFGSVEVVPMFSGDGTFGTTSELHDRFASV